MSPKRERLGSDNLYQSPTFNDFEEEKKTEDSVEQIYKRQLMGTEHVQGLVKDRDLEVKLLPDEYLNDNELYFLENLSLNEALIEYFHCMQEGLCCLFTQSKVLDGKYKFVINPKTPLSSALGIAG